MLKALQVQFETTDVNKAVFESNGYTDIIS